MMPEPRGVARRGVPTPAARRRSDALAVRASRMEEPPSPPPPAHTLPPALSLSLLSR